MEFVYNADCTKRDCDTCLCNSDHIVYWRIKNILIVLIHK